MEDEIKEANDAFDRKDYEAAFKKYLPLAERGNTEAQHRIGVMYASGYWVAKDEEEGLRWWFLSANQGNGLTQYALAMRYQIGSGVEQNIVEAVKWYMKSADQGYNGAQFQLGEIFTGGLGVKKNYVQAHYWFDMAEIHGNEEGREAKESLEKKMSQKQIVKSLELTLEWLENQEE